MLPLNNTRVQNIILDLDETLIYSSSFPINNHKPSYIINGINVYLRPYIKVFLSFCFNNFKTVNIWSNGTHEWVKPNIENILRFTKLNCYRYKIGFVRTRIHSEISNMTIYKNLNTVWNDILTPQNTIVIDDRINNYERSPGNCVQIKPYNVVYRDFELLKIINFLLKMRLENDVRDGISDFNKNSKFTFVPLNLRVIAF